jgi:hypothetical protein
MTNIYKIKAAEALAPMLDAFHLIHDKPLRAVRQVWTEGSLERLVLDFGPVSLVVTADENDDSIDIAAPVAAELRDGGVDASRLEPWKDFIGKLFSWGWVAVNQQGYCDGLLLSFGGIVPQLCLNVIASSIKVGTITGTA